MTTFTQYTPETANTEHAKETLTNIKNKYGFIPNLFAYMAEAPTTVDAYLMLNDLVSKTSLTSAQQQITLLTASVENDCEFCSVAHQAFGKLSKVDQQTMKAIVNGDEVKNQKDRALIILTKSIVKNRGRLTQHEIENFIDAGFTTQQIFEVILAVTIKTLSNYINHLTLPEPNKELLEML